MRRLLVLLILAVSCGDESNDSNDPDITLPSRDGGANAQDSAQPVDAGSDAPRVPDFVFVERDLNHVLATGQSLSVGARGDPPLTTSQPYDNVTFVTGVMNVQYWYGFRSLGVTIGSRAIGCNGAAPCEPPRKY